MKKELTTQINIKATPERVWYVLTDFDNYPKWNPFVSLLKGEVKEGNTIEVSLPGMKFKPRVLAFEKPREFRWLGHLFIKGLFDGEHSFVIRPEANGTVTFIHSEKFGGILVPLFSKMLETTTKQGFEQMNEKLKELSEK